MNTTLQDEALEQAERVVNDTAGGPGYYGRLYANIAKAEEAERVGLYFTKLRADELRAAADALEGR